MLQVVQKTSYNIQFQQLFQMFNFHVRRRLTSAFLRPHLLMTLTPFIPEHYRLTLCDVHLRETFFIIKSNPLTMITPSHIWSPMRSTPLTTITSSHFWSPMRSTPLTTITPSHFWSTMWSIPLTTITPSHFWSPMRSTLLTMITQSKSLLDSCTRLKNKIAWNRLRPFSLSWWIHTDSTVTTLKDML